MKKTTYVKGFIFALMAGILWGITGPLGQYLFDETTITPEGLVTCRLLVSGLLILTGVFVKKRWEIFSIWKNKKDALHMVVYSVAGMMAVQYSFFVAVEASNGGTATVLQYTNPAMIIVYMAVFQRVRPTAKEVAAVFLALAGIFLLSTNGNLHALSITPRGLLMGLLCAVFTCFYAMIPKRLMKKYDEVLVCGWSMLIGGIALALWKRPWEMETVADAEVLGLFLLLVLFGTVIPFIVSLKAIMVVGPMYANVLASIEPVVASFLTFFFLETTFGNFELVGFGLIVLTIFILSFHSAPKKKEA